MTKSALMKALYRDLTPEQRRLRAQFYQEECDKRRKRAFCIGYPKSLEGKPLCRIPTCLMLLSGRRTSFCSEEHSKLYSEFFMCFRDAVGYMNQYICAICKTDCTGQLWEADHIIPVIEGGETTLENGRVLCVPCHRSETRKLAQRRALARRPEQLSLEQVRSA